MRSAVALAALSALASTQATAVSGARTSRPSHATALRNDRPPVVLISIDTLRSDRLPAYGYREIATPAIDSLARDGIVVERAYTPSPLTLPAHTTLLTGVPASVHGVRDNLGYRLNPQGPPTLAERLATAGYRTVAAVSAAVLRHETGIARGFSRYDDELGGAGGGTLGEVQRAGEESLEVLIPEIEAAGAQPLFLFLHLYEPHAPYEPPGGAAAADAYDAEIVEADRVVQRLLASLRQRGLYDRSLIVLVSDHGEGLGDHGEAEHGILLNREVLQVPLIVKLPGNSRRGARLTSPASLIDVVPTVLDVLGLSGHESLVGRSLFSPPAGEPRAIYSETYYPRLRFGWSELLSIVYGRYHYVEGPRPELYDLEADPEERSNLQDAERQVVWTLRSLLADHRAPLAPPFAESPETRSRLASLGYLGSSSPDGDRERPDPKDRLEALSRFETALGSVRRGDLAAAARALETLVADSPEMLEAWQFLGLVYENRNDLARALDSYRRAYELSNGAPALGKQLARTLLRLDHPLDALAIITHGRAVQPEDPELAILAGETLLDLGRLAPAATAAADAVRLAGADGPALYLRARISLAQNELAAAERDLRRALDLAPDNREIRSELAVLLSAQGRLDESDAVLADPG